MSISIRAIGMVVAIALVVTSSPLENLKAHEFNRPAISSEIADLEFTDIRYLTRTLDDFGPRSAFVLVFSTTTCPIVQRFWPELNRIEREFRPRGVQFVAINVGPNDTIPEIAEQAIDHGVEFPFVKDTQGRCALAVGVSRTPEVVVLDRGRTLRYRGRISAAQRLGATAPSGEGVRADLVEAITDVLASRAVQVPETPVEGCKITLSTTLDRAPRGSNTPDFAEHVAPILQKHCQECHHVGGGAPFPLMNYRDTAAQAEMIAETVEQRRMPPWYASRRHGQFTNTRGLSDDERETLLRWVAEDRPRGDLRRQPPPRSFTTQNSPWRIGEPDQVVRMLGRHSLPAEGYIDYKIVILPHVFLEDTWVQCVEILPDNPRVLHHCNLAFATIGQSFSNDNFITGRVPGGDAMRLDPGTALKIPKGSVLALQAHYVSTGKPETCSLAVGLKFPKEPVKKQLHHSIVSTSRFAIPPGAPAHPVQTERTLGFDATMVGLFSHMHLRGKDMTFQAVRPGASEAEILLRIPNYHFDWQQSYRFAPGAMKLPRGTKLQAVAHFDNSAFNPFNPDPKATVRNGDQTYAEMMYGFYFYLRDDEDLNLTVDPATGRARPRK